MSIADWLKAAQLLIKKGEFQNALDKLSFVLMNDCKLISEPLRGPPSQREVLSRAVKPC